MHIAYATLCRTAVRHGASHHTVVRNFSTTVWWEAPWRTAVRDWRAGNAVHASTPFRTSAPMRYAPRISRGSEQLRKTVGDDLRGRFRRHGLLVATIAVADLNRAVAHRVTARDGDDRHADELGVLELDAR